MTASVEAFQPRHTKETAGVLEILDVVEELLLLHPRCLLFLERANGLIKLHSSLEKVYSRRGILQQEVLLNGGAGLQEVFIIGVHSPVGVFDTFTYHLAVLALHELKSF